MEGERIVYIGLAVAQILSEVFLNSLNASDKAYVNSERDSSTSVG